MEDRARQATSGMQMEWHWLAKGEEAWRSAILPPTSHSETECCRSKLLMDIAVVHWYTFGDLKPCS